MRLLSKRKIARDAIIVLHRKVHSEPRVSQSVPAAVLATKLGAAAGDVAAKRIALSLEERISSCPPPNSYRIARHSKRWGGEKMFVPSA